MRTYLSYLATASKDYILPRPLISAVMVKGQGSAPTAVALSPVAVLLCPARVSRDGDGEQGLDQII